jgi:hypothetical protein
MSKLFVFFFSFFLCYLASAQDTLLLINGKKIIVSSVDVSDYTIAYKKSEAGAKLKKIDAERVFSIIYRDGQEKMIFKTDSLDPLDFREEEMRNFILGEVDARKLYKNNVVKITGFAIGFGFSYFGHFYGLVGPPIYGTIVGSVSPVVEKKLTFMVSGNAAGDLGIKEGEYMNDITGINSVPVLKKDQVLKIGGKSIKFREETPLDSAIAVINSKFSCHRVNAANDNGKLKLYRTDTPALINDVSYREGFEKQVREYKIKNSVLYGFAGFVAGFIVFSTVFND